MAGCVRRPALQRSGSVCRNGYCGMSTCSFITMRGAYIPPQSCSFPGNTNIARPTSTTTTSAFGTGGTSTPASTSSQHHGASSSSPPSASSPARSTSPPRATTSSYLTTHISSKTIGERLEQTHTISRRGINVVRLLSRIAAWDNGWKGSNSSEEYSYQRDQDGMSDMSSIRGRRESDMSSIKGPRDSSIATLR
jgi:hypothetical protein